MMKTTRFIMLAVLMLTAAITTNAYDFKVGDLCYNKNSDGTTVYVTYEYSSGRSYTSMFGDLNIPSTVTYEGITYSVTGIGDGAFAGCDGLTSVTIPNSVTSIGWESFYGCWGMTSIDIPSSVTTIDEDAFDECTSLTRVNITDLAAWCEISFTKSLSNPLKFAHHLYLNGTEVKNLVVPNSVTSIGKYAFYGCEGLTSVTIPNSITSINTYTFYGCTGLMSVTIGNSVESIGAYAFYDCSSLTSVEMGNSVNTIGNYAFSGCVSLANIYCMAQNPPSISSRTFRNVDKQSCKLHVLEGRASAYSAANCWSEFISIVEDLHIDTSTPGPDGNTYPEIDGIKLESLWMRDLQHYPDAYNALGLDNNYCFNATMIGGIIYILDIKSDGQLFLHRINALTGSPLTNLVVTLAGAPFYSEVDVSNIRFGKDEYGHAWFVDAETAPGSYYELPLYTINLQTGAASLITNHRHPTIFGGNDYYNLYNFDLKGDVTRQASDYVLAVIGSSDHDPDDIHSILFYWNSSYYSNKDKRISTNKSGCYGTVHMIKGQPVSGTAEPAIIDIGTEKPWDYKTGTFINDPNNLIKAGLSGTHVFDVGSTHLIAYAQSNSPVQNAGISLLPDYDLSQAEYLWTIPADGLGSEGDGGYRVHRFDTENIVIDGQEVTLLMFYSCRNGLAVYKISRDALNDNIVFESEATKTACLVFDSNRDGELSYREAAAVTNIGSTFSNNTQIDLFDEFQYFTGLTEIPADGFNYCSSLKKITPPPSVTSIGENAFYYCSQLTDFDFTHIKRIDSYAFNRAGLTHVTLPSTVEYIGYASFYLTTNGCTVHLDHNSIDVYNGFEPYGSPTSGIIFPIVGADDTLEVNRGYFHEAYTTCPFNYRKAVTPYVTHEDGFLPFTTLSCEAPLKLTDPDVEVYIITGFNPTRYVFTTKRYNGEVLPANKGVLLRFKDISGRYYAFPQATAYEGTFDFGQNLLSASTQFTTIGSDDDYWNFSTVSWYNGSETDYKNWTLAYVPSGNPTSSNACEAYLRLPKSLFDESGMDVGEGAMIEVDFSLVGDVNEDDELGVADITKLVNLILSSEVNDHSDVNCDGETGVADLTKLVNILLEE